MDEEARRKLRAKRFNEHVKLLVTTVNAVALIAAGTGAIQPIISTGIGSNPLIWLWIGVGVILHICAQALVRLIQPE
jgi:hypothetical protein